MNFRYLASLLMAILVIALSCSQTSQGRVSKKFLKGFLLGAYMAKHHEPIVIHMEKSKKG